MELTKLEPGDLLASDGRIAALHAGLTTESHLIYLFQEGERHCFLVVPYYAGGEADPSPYDCLPIWLHENTRDQWTTPLITRTYLEAVVSIEALAISRAGIKGATELSDLHRMMGEAVAAMPSCLRSGEWERSERTLWRSSGCGGRIVLRLTPGDRPRLSLERLTPASPRFSLVKKVEITNDTLTDDLRYCAAMAAQYPYFMREAYGA